MHNACAYLLPVGRRCVSAPDMSTCAAGAVAGGSGGMFLRRLSTIKDFVVCANWGVPLGYPHVLSPNIVPRSCSYVILQGTSEDVCHQDYYLNTSHPQANKPALGSHNSNCVPCSTCIPGQGIQTHCLNTTDTKCQACTHGYYSQYSASFNNRFCTVCTNCSTLNRIEVTECTPLEDTVCGKCSKGYFLSVNYDGSTNCVKCSYCPSDKNVVRWYECADLPDNQQCAPGRLISITYC